MSKNTIAQKLGLETHKGCTCVNGYTVKKYILANYKILQLQSSEN